jgi:hypothetical protein
VEGLSVLFIRPSAQNSIMKQKGAGYRQHRGLEADRVCLDFPVHPPLCSARDRTIMRINEIGWQACWENNFLKRTFYR